MTVGHQSANGSGERGSAVVELVVVTPVLVVLMLFVVFCGRLQGDNQDVQSASGAAARAASLQRSAPGAAGAARRTAEEVLADRQVTCETLRVELDITGGAEDGGGTAGLGNSDEVTVTVSCEVSLEDVTGLRVGSARTLRASATEVIDRYRAS